MIVVDEHGWRWAVQNGDPAASIIVALEKQGFRSITLPRATIVGGVPVSGPTIAALEKQAEVYEMLTELDDETRKTLADSLLAQMALYDICTAMGRIEGLTPTVEFGTMNGRQE